MKIYSKPKGFLINSTAKILNTENFPNYCIQIHHIVSKMWIINLHSHGLYTYILEYALALICRNCKHVVIYTFLKSGAFILSKLYFFRREFKNWLGFFVYVTYLLSVCNYHFEHMFLCRKVVSCPITVYRKCCSVERLFPYLDFVSHSPIQLSLLAFESLFPSCS